MRIPTLLATVAILLVATLAAPSRPVIPHYWDERERVSLPDISDFARVRFLTTIDFPPFNYLGPGGRLTGFHVDLARAICDELDIADICQIQALPWEELEDALTAGEGEALIAGIAITAEARRDLAFTRPFLRFPARFVTLRDQAMDEPMYRAVEGERIGVIAGSAHEAMLREYFPDARPVTYSRSSWMMRDLREGRLAAAFGDGMRLSFWLDGEESEQCCRFAGGPYHAQEYLGHGLAITTTIENEHLAKAFDFALREITVKGTFAELYLRYFPVSFY